MADSAGGRGKKGKSAALPPRRGLVKSMLLSSLVKTTYRILRVGKKKIDEAGTRRSEEWRRWTSEAESRYGKFGG